MIILLLKINDLIVFSAYDRSGVTVTVDKDDISFHTVAERHAVIQIGV